MRRLFNRIRRLIRPPAQTLGWRLAEWGDRLLFNKWAEPYRVRSLVSPTSASNCVAVHTIHVDVAVIHKHDAGTGIQRVVRSIRANLANTATANQKIIPVAVESMHSGYEPLSGGPMVGSPGSVFYGLDFSTDTVWKFRDQLRQYKEDGGSCWFNVNDLLPIQQPEWFTPASALKYRRWLRTCAALADGIICISEPVADDVREHFRTRYRMTDLPEIRTIELGSDITDEDRAAARQGRIDLPGLDDATLSKAAIVVGTIEPRKGHAELLGAFELLWRDGHDIPLLIVGRRGWHTEALQASIENSPQFGRNLFWFDNLDDISLRAAYGHCRMAICPSLAEGYGLPMDEALALGTPVLARDLRVFRRHHGAAIRHFPVDASLPVLAQEILDFHRAVAVRPPRIALPDWAHTSAQTLCILTGPANRD